MVKLVLFVCYFDEFVNSWRDRKDRQLLVVFLGACVEINLTVKVLNKIKFIIVTCKER